MTFLYTLQRMCGFVSLDICSKSLCFLNGRHARLRVFVSCAANARSTLTRSTSADAPKTELESLFPNQDPVGLGGFGSFQVEVFL